jgi:hypothetical protein
MYNIYKNKSLISNSKQQGRNKEKQQMKVFNKRKPFNKICTLGFGFNVTV